MGDPIENFSDIKIIDIKVIFLRSIQFNVKVNESRKFGFDSFCINPCVVFVSTQEKGSKRSKRNDSNVLMF